MKKKLKQCVVPYWSLMTVGTGDGGWGRVERPLGQVSKAVLRRCNRFFLALEKNSANARMKVYFWNGDTSGELIELFTNVCL